MNKINITMLVSPMGHDVNRICTLVSKWLSDTGVFNITVAGTYPKAELSIEEFMLDPQKVAATDVFYFLCSDEYWNNPQARNALEDAVSAGKGIVFSHGLHPCFQTWPEAERMIGLLWRETATHGDFNYCDVKITEEKHPITEGVAGFHTKDELFCGLTNVWNVDMKVLATAYSDKNLVSRWGAHGTGNDEPVITVGNYGKGRTVNYILGHVWTYYTGHGLGEDTMMAFEPPQMKTMILRSLEWAATGEVKIAKNI